MAVTAAVTAAVASVGAGYSQMRSTAEQNKAQEKASRIEQRRASLEAQRQARRAIAQTRMMNAEMVQGTESMGARTSSSLIGATGSAMTQTAANIGGMNTQLAGEIGINNALRQGARRAARWNTVAGGLDAVGSIAQAGMGVDWSQGTMGGTTTFTPAGPAQQAQFGAGQPVNWQGQPTFKGFYGKF